MIQGVHCQDVSVDLLQDVQKLEVSVVRGDAELQDEAVNFVQHQHHGQTLLHRLLNLQLDFHSQPLNTINDQAATRLAPALKERNGLIDVLRVAGDVMEGEQISAFGIRGMLPLLRLGAGCGGVVGQESGRGESESLCCGGVANDTLSMHRISVLNWPTVLPGLFLQCGVAPIVARSGLLVAQLIATMLGSVLCRLGDHVEDRVGLRKEEIKEASLAMQVAAQEGDITKKPLLGEEILDLVGRRLRELITASIALHIVPSRDQRIRSQGGEGILRMDEINVVECARPITTPSLVSIATRRSVTRAVRCGMGVVQKGLGLCFFIVILNNDGHISPIKRCSISILAGLMGSGDTVLLGRSRCQSGGGTTGERKCFMKWAHKIAIRIIIVHFGCCNWGW